MLERILLDSGDVNMKSCQVELSDELYAIYEDIARLNHKPLEECLSIVLDRVIRTMLKQNSPEGVRQGTQTSVPEPGETGNR